MEFSEICRIFQPRIIFNGRNFRCVRRYMLVDSQGRENPDVAVFPVFRRDRFDVVRRYRASDFSVDPDIYTR